MKTDFLNKNGDFWPKNSQTNTHLIFQLFQPHTDWWIETLTMTFSIFKYYRAGKKVLLRIIKI